ASELPANYDQIRKSNPIQAAYILGEVNATVKSEFSRIESVLAKSAAKPEPKPALPKPSTEVTVNANTTPVDELTDAINRGDTEAYKRIMNKRETDARTARR